MCGEQVPPANGTPWLDEQAGFRTLSDAIALVISAFAHDSRWEGSTKNATISGDDQHRARRVRSPHESGQSVEASCPQIADEL